MKFKCSKCSSNDIRVYKVRYKNDTWHVKGVCHNCKKGRYLNRGAFFREDLPELVLKRNKDLFSDVVII